jgi:ubiquitin-conjugating enzyme E2 variant
VVNLAGQIAQLPGITAKVAAGALAAGSVVAGWAAADFGSGIFHWAVDNYPTRNTPVLGKLADEFQNHHHERYSILKNSSWSNLSQAGVFATIPLVALGLANPHYAITAGLTSMMFGTTMTQASHRWSHDAKCSKFAKTLQKLHIAQSRKNHAMHHAAPWDDYYCIVNGMWNPLLHRTNFWRKLEKGVYMVTGRESKAWRDPGVKALALGQITREQFEADRKVNRAIFREVAGRDYEEYKAIKAAKAEKQQ